jgi:hypothetical protein
MRLPREWLTIRRQMIIIAVASLYLGWIARMIAPLNEMPPMPLPSPPGPQPRLEVPDPIVNLGRLPQMAQGRHTWVVNNTGPAPLEMWLAATPGCSCPRWSIEEVRIDGNRLINALERRDRARSIHVPPGGQAAIVVRWETKRFLGPNHSDMDLGTNDPKAPEFRLTLLAEVVPPELPPDQD